MDQLSSTTITVLSATLLGFLLTTACWTDLRDRRIPNKLVLIGTITAIALHILAPAGAGLFNPTAGSLGVVKALYGFATGFCLLIPFYLLRTLGAGDVKLMAMVGAFLGPSSVLGTVLLTFLAGGILAITVALCKGVFKETLTNVYSITTHTLMNAASGHRPPVAALSNSTIKLPYALPIAAGTVLQIILARNGHSLFS